MEVRDELFENGSSEVFERMRSLKFARHSWLSPGRVQKVPHRMARLNARLAPLAVFLRSCHFPQSLYQRGTALSSSTYYLARVYNARPCILELA